MDEEIITSTHIELGKLQDLGAIDYYLPSDPIGESFVVSVFGQLQVMNPMEAFYFVAGAMAVGKVILDQQGGVIAGLPMRFNPR